MMTPGDVRRALVRYLDWYANIIVPEYSLSRHGTDRADIICLTRAGYVTEYEIKVDPSDWRDDRKKWKFTRSPLTGNDYVARLFYVVPGRWVLDTKGEVRGREPAIRVPDNLLPGAGIILAMKDKHWLGCHELRAAKRHKVKPLPDHEVRRLMDTFYYRYWRLMYDHDVLMGDYRDYIDANKQKADAIRVDPVAR